MLGSMLPVKLKPPAPDRLRLRLINTDSALMKQKTRWCELPGTPPPAAAITENTLVKCVKNDFMSVSELLNVC